MKTKNDRIYAFLKNLDTKIDLVNLVDIDEINMNKPFESISEMIEEKTALM